MNTAGNFGVYSVQNRARLRESAHVRAPSYRWDTDDPVGFRTQPRRPAANTARTAGTAQSAAANSYRVRDAAIRAQKKAYERRAAMGDQPHARAERMRSTGRTIPEDRRRTRAAPDSLHNTDEIFRANAGERRRMANRVHTLYQATHTAPIVLLMLILTAFLGFLVYRNFFVVDDVRLEGSELYSDEEILAATGVRKGDNLYSFSSRVVEENVTLRLPYVRSLEVQRTIPDTVHFAVTEDAAAFCTELYGETWALSGSLRVLEPISESETDGLIRLRLPEVESAVAGRVLQLRDERTLTRIREVLSAVLASSLRERITAVDLRDSWKLTMVSDGAYLLDFGNGEDAETMLRVAYAVLSDPLFDGSIKAQIDLTMSGSTSVIFDDQLQLDT